jgi:hypothetical protein
MSNFERVTAIDPGLTSGWAQFTAKKLSGAGVFREHDYPAVWHRGYEQTLVIEVPRIYPHRSKGDPNDIVQLALTVGEIRGHYRPQVTRIVETYPASWKGQVPKEIHHARVLKQLADDETRILAPHARRFSKTHPHGFDHNLLDAVALGLWFLRRE